MKTFKIILPVAMLLASFGASGSTFVTEQVVFIMEHNQEIWKDIIGFEGLYQISNCGNVRSLDRVIIRVDGKLKTFKGKILKQFAGEGKYFHVCLCRNSISKTKEVHVLVGKYFINNPLNKKTINHKDGNKSNNNDWNLEWNTQSENNAHAYRNGLKKHHRCWKGKTGADHNKSKEVIEYDLNGVELRRFGSAKEASRILNVPFSAIQTRCVSNNKKPLNNKLYTY